jgi:hypothetical protein
MEDDVTKRKLHHRAKLPDDIIRKMRAEHLPYVRGYGYLAKKYGCGVSTARDLATFRTRAMA